MVRGLSMLDAFGVGLMNQGITPSIWTMVTWGLGTYLSGNLFWACIISLVLVGFGFPLVWGILSGSMPRSGGEYIYNSRIIHPVVGIAESFGNAFVMIFWVYVLAPWIADPGLVIWAEYMGWTWLYDPVSGAFFGGLSYEWGVFVVATIANILAVLTMVFGVKIFATIQKAIMFVALGGAAVITGSIMLTQQGRLRRELGQARGAVRLAQVQRGRAGRLRSHRRGGAHELGPLRHARRDGRRLLAVRLRLLLRLHRRRGQAPRQDPDRRQLHRHPGAGPVRHLDGALALQGDAIRVRLGHRLDRQQRRHRGLQHALPAELHEPRLHRPRELVRRAAASISYILFTFWYLALSYMAFPRIIFAWGMDRMGPKWFTSVNPRWASPVKNYILCFVLCQAAIALYTFWIGSYMQGLTITGMEIVSVWGITTIAALVFPYVKRARGIWDSSPYRTWKFLGIPLVSWGAAVSLVYLAILFYFLIFTEEMRDSNGQSWILYCIIWALGVVWYFIWKSRSKKVGIDIGMTYGELPPE